MMKKLSFYFLFVSTALVAQEKSGCLQLSEAQVLIGSNLSLLETLSLSDFNTLAPGSSILAKDYTGFSSDYYTGTYTNPSYTGLLGFTFKNKPNPLLRLGVGYSTRTLGTGSSSRYDSFHYDTLTSAQTGEQIFLDSTHSQNMYGGYQSTYLSLDASLIFRTKPSARWSIYGGIGVNVGMAFNSFVDIHFHDYHYVPNSDYNQSNWTHENERFNQKTHVAGTVYVPMGLDFRLGKKREFLNRLHLFVETRPSMTITTIPSLKTLVTPNITSSFGLRIVW
jgi:hypothetical protein